MNSAKAPRAYTKLARAAGEQRTREKLLDAAEAAFFDGRWESASLEEIAAAAGVTKQTLLRHFGSRAGLRDEAMARAMDRVREQRWTAPSDDVGGAVAVLVDHYEEVGGRAMLIGRLAARDHGVEEDVGGPARQMHYEWVDHAFGPRLGRLGPARRRRCRAALIALCDVQTWWILSHDLALPRREVEATLTQAIEAQLEEVP